MRSPAVRRGRFAMGNRTARGSIPSGGERTRQPLMRTAPM
jgi:hypothetical protein